MKQKLWSRIVAKQFNKDITSRIELKKSFWIVMKKILTINRLFFVVITCSIFFLKALTNFVVTLDEKKQLIIEFDERDNSLNNGEGYSNYSIFNEDGTLAWGQSYLLNAYIDMYEVTKDIKYIQKIISQADKLIANTDQARNLRDYRGNSVLGWGATTYSLNNIRVVYLVHTGMITYPLVKFAMLVEYDKNLRSYRQKASEYKKFSTEALSFFDPEWKFNQDNGEGFYTFKEIEQPDTNETNPNNLQRSLPLPFNQQLAAGRTMLMLCQLSKKSPFCDKSEALAKHFKNRIILETNGSYVWKYWYGDVLKVYPVIEDVSHGAIDIDFAILAYRNGIVFDKNDLERFVKTYTKNISRQEGIANSVNGREGLVETSYEPVVGLWMELAEYDCTVWHDFRLILEENEISSSDTVAMLGIAKLAKYYNLCVGRNNFSLDKNKNQINQII